MGKKKKRRGHYCWMCGRHRPNERFSGGGHRDHLCKDCSRLPKAQRARRRAWMDLDGYLQQRSISAKNVAHLEELCGCADEEVRARAELVLAVARIHPTRRKRIGFLKHNHPDLLARLTEAGAQA